MRTLSHGFSLIELMLVVTIIGILSALSIPAYQDYITRARFAEVIAATAPFKTAIALALQTGIEPNEITNSTHGVPAPPAPTKNLASLKVENSIIIATASALAKNKNYVLTPNADGSQWTVSGSCLKASLCEE